MWAMGDRLHNRFARKSNTPLKAVSIARTLETPQTEVESFINQVGKKLDRRGEVLAVTSARMTILESKGIRRAHRRAHADPKAVSNFSYRLSNHLDQYRTQDIDVTVDPKEPIKLFGRNSNRLSLNFLLSDQLIEERRRVDDFLLEEFGEVPHLKELEPHVSLAKVCLRALTSNEIEYPSLLVPEAMIPTTVALNGLSVFLDGKALKH